MVDPAAPRMCTRVSISVRLYLLFALKTYDSIKICQSIILSIIRSFLYRQKRSGSFQTFKTDATFKQYELLLAIRWLVFPGKLTNWCQWCERHDGVFHNDSHWWVHEFYCWLVILNAHYIEVTLDWPDNACSAKNLYLIKTMFDKSPTKYFRGVYRIVQLS